MQVHPAQELAIESIAAATEQQADREAQRAREQWDEQS